MNKVVGGDFVKERDLRSDYDFLQKLDKANTSLENKIWSKFCDKNLAPDVDLDDRRRFISHPRRIISDSDVSKSTVSSPRLFTLLPRPSDSKCYYAQNRETGTCYSQRLKSKLTQLFLDDVSEYQSTNKLLDMGDGYQNYEQSELNMTKCQIIEGSDLLDPCFGEGNEMKPTKKKCLNKKTNKKSAPLKSVLKNRNTSRNDASNVSFETYRAPARKRGLKNSAHPQLQSEKSDLSLGAFSMKVKIIIQKCLSYIKDISSFIEKGIVAPDGHEDYLRRMKRVQEFSNRFSRNYLYPLARQLNDMDLSKTTNINQKILSSYQIVQQALQMYLNHLPSSAGNCASDKLKQLLGHTVHLYQIHQSMNNDDNQVYSDKEYLDVLNSHISLLTEDIEYNFENKITHEKPTRECKKSSADMKENKSNNVALVCSKKKKKGHSKLSMYTTNYIPTYRKEPPWKKISDVLMKKRYNVKSRYKTAMYKHRPPAEKFALPEEPPRTMLNLKRSSHTTLIKTPVVTPINEDEIETMIEKVKPGDESSFVETVILEPDKRSQIISVETKVKKCCDKGDATNREEVPENMKQDTIEKLLHLVKCAQKQADSGTTHLQSDVYNDLAQTVDFLQNCLANPTKKNQEMFNNLIRKLGFGNNEKWTNFNMLTTSTGYAEAAQIKTRKEPTISVTGVKNAKLFHIIDNNEIEGEKLAESRSQECGTLINGNLRINSTTQTDLTDMNTKNPNVQKSRTSIKISRLPKHSLKQLAVLPKDYAINVIQYKMDFQNHCKSNHMYDKQSAIVPWLLTGKISDNLLEYALSAVTSEIEVGGILETLYRAEFQC